jgi:hypothetical protein
MTKKRTKDEISIAFWGKPFKEIELGQCCWVNSEYAHPNSVWKTFKKRIKS